MLQAHEGLEGLLALETQLSHLLIAAGLDGSDRQAIDCGSNLRCWPYRARRNFDRASNLAFEVDCEASNNAGRPLQRHLQGQPWTYNDEPRHLRRHLLWRRQVGLVASFQ